MEIIHLVEHSSLPIRKTLKELDVPSSTFYRWYMNYQEDGFDRRADRKSNPRQFWNRIPDYVRQQFIDMVLSFPEKSPKQLAWFFVDQMVYFISESSVYRILKRLTWYKAQSSIWCQPKISMRNPPKEYMNYGKQISPNSR